MVSKWQDALELDEWWKPAKLLRDYTSNDCTSGWPKSPHIQRVANQAFPVSYNRPNWSLKPLLEVWVLKFWTPDRRVPQQQALKWPEPQLHHGGILGAVSAAVGRCHAPGRKWHGKWEERNIGGTPSVKWLWASLWARWMKLSNRPIDIITATLKGDPSRTHSPDNRIDHECDYTISWYDYVPWTHHPQRTRSKGYYTVVLFFVVSNLMSILLCCCCSALSYITTITIVNTTRPLVGRYDGKWERKTVAPKWLPK